MTSTTGLAADRPPNPSLTQGDFRANGSWNPAMPASRRGPRYRFVQSLVRVRKAAHVSPAQLAEQIEASEFAGMFAELAAWKAQPDWSLWATVPARTVADETVKRCGIGALEEFHWEGGECVGGEDQRNLPSADPEKIHAFIAGLEQAIGGGAAIERRKSDQEFFEGAET